MERKTLAEDEKASRPSPHAPQPPASESRRAGAEAAVEHLGSSSEGDTAPETAISTGRGTAHAQYHSQIPPGFSLVVNDVDAEGEGDRHGLKAPPEKKMVVSEDVPAEDKEPNKRGTLSHSHSQKELSDARIKQIQGEVESRKNEFARLLEEHAQVVEQLKAMEEEESGDGVQRQQVH